MTKAIFKLVTQTKIGNIPHVWHSWRGFRIYAPVKLAMKADGESFGGRSHRLKLVMIPDASGSNQMTMPKFDSNGFLIYAAPGGGEIFTDYRLVDNPTTRFAGLMTPPRILVSESGSEIDQRGIEARFDTSEICEGSYA